MINFTSLDGDSRPLWGSLTPGPYPIGLRLYWRIDLSRVYGATPGARRPILVAVWYPAAVGDAVAPLRQAEYLNLPDIPAPAEFRDRYIAFCREVIAEETGGTDARAAFQEVQTAAYAGAVPAPGRFPLVLNHPGLGAAYADNSGLHEYLASHGYIVVGSAFESEDAGQVNLDWDLDRSIKDLEFLVNVAADTLPNADLDRIGAVGHSYGAQAVVVWHSGVNNPLRAAVSLDATMEYASPDEPGLARLRERIVGGDRATAPLLVFTSARQEARYDIYEPVCRADRYFATLAGVRHNDFLVHGAFAADWRGEPAVRAAYDALCRCVLGFLNGALKGQEAFLAELRARGRTRERRRPRARHRVPPGRCGVAIAYNRKQSER